MNAHAGTLGDIAEEVWQALVERDPYMATTAGLRPSQYPRGDLAEAEAVAANARERLARLKYIDSSQLDRTECLTLAHLRYWLENEACEPSRWWTGFGVTPYSMSTFSIMPQMLFPSIDLADAAEAERYLALAEGYVLAVAALRNRLVAQADAGWRLPRPAIGGGRNTIDEIAAAAAATIDLEPDRKAPPEVRAHIKALVETRLRPAFAELRATLDDEYERLASEEAGMCHQPDGVDAYRNWVRYHLNYDADPSEIHDVGLAEVANLAEAMRRVRVEAFDHSGDEASFHSRLRNDSRAKVATAEELEATYKRHLARMEPVFARLVRKVPRATARIQRLAPALEAGMTFGYYEPPPTPGADGIYHYSGNGIPERMQLNAAPLIFHELVPGHHVAIARQSENDALPDLRRRTFSLSAFNEGWAEYSAGLAEEAGLYEDPYDLYGWLAHQRFVAQRLVVDTGLNFHGWPLERARAYMRANTMESEAQIASETLRYATDMPGQALAYRMGFLKFREMRERVQARLGEDFDLADFHEAILDQGGLPLEVLEDALDSWDGEREPAAST